MSGYTNQSDSFDDNGYGRDERQESGAPSGLRRQLEEVLAKNKELEKKLAERQSKDAEALLKDKGLDPAVKEMIPEGANPSEWIEKYSHLLGAKGTEREVKEAPGDSGPKDEAPEGIEDPAVTLEREALARIQGAADSGSPAHLMGDVLERMDKIQSEEELMKFFGSNGAVGG